MTQTPAELLEAVLQRTLSKPNLTQEDRKALESAVFAVRTLPQVGTVKRNLVPKLLESITATEDLVQWILSHREDLPGEDEDPKGKEEWETIAKNLQTTLENLRKIEAKKAAKKTTPTREPRP